jgi:TolB-like protein
VAGLGVADIFLSYEHRDLCAAERVARALIQAGYSVWWDRRLLAGESWTEALRAELRAARAVLVLWSERAWTSRWVQAEAHAGHERECLISARLDDVRLEPPFNIIQTADLRHDDPSAIASLIQAVAARLGNPALARDAPAVASPAEPLLAVLPFDNMSTDPDMQYFSDGVSEEILVAVSRGSAIRVVGRASSFRFRGADKHIPRVAAELRATHVLDGSVRRQGNRVRISTELVAAADQTCLWSDRFDRDLEDLFALQDEIAAAVAAALRRAFHPAVRKGGRPLEPKLLDLVLRSGRVRLTESSSEAEHYRNIALLEEALAAAPESARIRGLLAVTLALARPYLPEEQVVPMNERVRAEVQRTLAIDPDESSAHMALALVEENWVVREKLMEKAAAVARLEPFYPLGFAYLDLGRVSAGIAQNRKAYEVDPLHPAVANAYATALMIAGERREARAILARIETAGVRSAFVAANSLYWAALDGDWTEVERRSQASEIVHLGSLAGTVLASIPVMRNPGDPMGERFLDQLQRACRHRLRPPILLLAFCAEFIDTERAFAAFTPWPAQFGFTAAGTAQPPDFGPQNLFHHAYPKLRADPRFVTICARLGLADYWVTTDRWPDCRAELDRAYGFEALCRAAVSGA